MVWWLLSLVCLAAAQQDDPLKSVQSLFHAMRIGSADMAQAILHPEARLATATNVSLQLDPVSAFLHTISTTCAQAPAYCDERISNPQVHMSDSLAQIWADYQFYRGGELSHCGVDAFQLWLDTTQSVWLIFQITDTRHDCPATVGQ
eukprot:TRINITY_DN726_c0_g1_i2.p1 TRINITY_DN726_c0_g1~~TRINITY_DN726_c0_g1_i2.p1  ORF type:complete len:147 (+),score=18.81 TRINITY_DN726_c0_g1_i2:311-751(+)